MRRPLHLSSRGIRSKRGGPRRDGTASLGTTSLEAVDRFVRILARCGGAPGDIDVAVRAACRRIPKAWRVRARGAKREISDAAHVLTLWFTEPAFLDPLGEPRPLPLRGSSQSLAALVRSVDSRLDAREVLRYLLLTGAVRPAGARYVPRARSVLLRGARGPDYFRTLRVLANMLRTLEHNVRPQRVVRGWFEYFAENPRFPASARAAFDARVNRLGKEFLYRLDAYMRRREIRRRPGEPTVRLGLGMHLWEDAGSRPQGASAEGRLARRGVVRRPTRGRRAMKER